MTRPAPSLASSLLAEEDGLLTVAGVELFARDVLVADQGRGEAKAPVVARPSAASAIRRRKTVFMVEVSGEVGVRSAQKLRVVLRAKTVVVGSSCGFGVLAVLNML